MALLSEDRSIDTRYLILYKLKEILRKACLAKPNGERVSGIKYKFEKLETEVFDLSKKSCSGQQSFINDKIIKSKLLF